jgi:uncharacterized membrane protein YcgQ (UPF0703/DUF1980 family)
VNGVVELPLSKIVNRSKADGGASMEGAVLRTEGFMFEKDGNAAIGRYMIFCCAADGILRYVAFDQPRADRFAEGTWVRADLRVERVTRDGEIMGTLVDAKAIDPPADPYIYP